MLDIKYKEAITAFNNALTDIIAKLNEIKTTAEERLDEIDAADVTSDAQGSDLPSDVKAEKEELEQFVADIEDSIDVMEREERATDDWIDANGGRL